LESARAALAQAQRAHAQNESLSAQRFISQAALEASRAALDTAKAQVAAAEAALNTARLSLSDASVVAPIAGIVSRRHALPGEKVSPEQTLVTVVDISKLELAGAVGMHLVARLKPGMPVQVSVEGIANPIAGAIARIAPAAEPGTRSIGVAVVLPNPGEVMRGGQFAVARVRLSESTARLTLPEAAVRSSSGQHHVWVLGEGRLQRRVVQLGRRDAANGRVEIRDGVTPEVTVLAAAFDNLKDGRRATRVAERAPAPASAASR
jgi:RND family efflux transporter MFP subunit